MRYLLLVPAALIAVVAPTLPATGATESVPTASAASPTDSCLTRYRQIDQLRYIRSVYHRSTVSRTARRRMRRMASCSYSPEATENMRRLRKRQGRARRERAVAEDCTPYGDWAIPGYIVMRESRGRNVPNASGSDASGYYQMMDASYHAYGGPDLPGPYDAMHSPKPVQDCVAERMWAGGAGSHHWAATR